MGTRKYQPVMTEHVRDWPPYLDKCTGCIYYTHGDRVCNHLLLTDRRRRYDPTVPEHNCGSWEPMDARRLRQMQKQSGQGI